MSRRPLSRSMSRRLRRVAAFAAAAVALAGGALVATVPAHALDPIPGGFATWHEYEPATPGGNPQTLAMDAADNVWYADSLSNQIVRVPTGAPATARAYDLGPSTPGIGSIAFGLDGSVWYSDTANGAIGRLDPASGAVDTYPLGGPFDWASSLVAGPGGDIWFGDPQNYGLGAIAPDGHITRIPEPSGTEIAILVAAPDGRLWYPKDRTGELGAYDPRTGVFESILVPGGIREFTGLSLSNTGDLWVGGVDALTRLGLDGSVKASVTLPPSPAGYTAPRRLVPGIESELHFTDPTMGIATVSASGRVTYARPPFAGSVPDRLAVTSSGSLWYTDALRATLGNV